MIIAIPAKLVGWMIELYSVKLNQRELGYFLSRPDEKEKAINEKPQREKNPPRQNSI